jgi:hypothetical protein
VMGRRNGLHLREQNESCQWSIMFCSSRDGVRVGNPARWKGCRNSRQHKIQNCGALQCETIEMRVERIVQENVARANAKPTPVSAFFVLAGEHYRRIGSAVKMPGKERPAAAEFATGADGSE